MLQTLSAQRALPLISAGVRGKMKHDSQRAHHRINKPARSSGRYVIVRTNKTFSTAQLRGVLVGVCAANKPSVLSVEYSQDFLRARLSVFLSILFGYSCYYLTRNSLTFTAPAMVASPALNLDITSIGVITSIFPLCYGCSKFVSGVVGDILSPSLMLGGGLIATGLVNVAFGASHTLPLFCILWATNGILQVFGAPSCAKILTSWFAAS